MIRRHEISGPVISNLPQRRAAIQMQIDLRAPIRQMAFASGCLLVTALYLLLSARSFWAAHLAARPGVFEIERAIQLEPSNAEYRAVLARNLALSVSTLDDAVRNFRIASSLNPYESSYWLGLADTCQLAGRTDEQIEAVQMAARADPMTPQVAWDAANFFLVRGDIARAFSYFRTVLSNDPEFLDSTLRLCWRASGDANQIFDQALPKRPDVYLSFLRLLVAKQEIAAAKNAWDHLIALHQPFPVKPTLPYFRLMIASQEVAAAGTAWQQLAQIDEQIRPYLSSPENLVVNGGFEETLLNGGFDWWYEPNPLTKLAIDTEQSFSGTRSLSVTFDGHNAPDAGIAEFVPVKPNTDYEFSVEMKTQDIDSASGPRFAVGDAYTLTPYVLTDDLLGSNPWHKQQSRFHTGPGTSLIFVKITREPAAPLIRGKLWVDDVRLVEASKQGVGH